MQDPKPQTPAAKAFATSTSKMEVADLILALCEAGEWDLALRMAREQNDK